MKSINSRSNTVVPFEEASRDAAPTEKVDLSVVVPVYGCPEALAELLLRIRATTKKLKLTDEIILVNDACPRNSWREIRKATLLHHSIKAINFSRNFGQHIAIRAGLNASRGEWVIVMDCDLQDLPEEIEKLYYAAITKETDIVLAERVHRNDTTLKKATSKLFYSLLGYLTDTDLTKQASVANFGIYHSKVIEYSKKFQEQDQFFPLMIRWLGFTTTSIEVNHAERKAGDSGYSFCKLFSLATDIIISYSHKPLKLCVKFGFLMSTVSVLVAVTLVLFYLNNVFSVPGWASIIVSLWFLAGLIVSILGVLGIYIGKIFDNVKDRPLYVVRDIIDSNELAGERSV